MSFDKIKEIAESEKVKEGLSFRDLINKELVLGQTKYVCRYGTLSDGHDKVTDAQRFYQATREMYSIANEMTQNMADAMNVKADILEAEEMPESKESHRLRKQSKLMMSRIRLEGIYISLQDKKRQLDEYARIHEELKDAVRAKYPQGIEQAERDNWIAVAEYWAFKKQIGANSNPLTHIPLDPETKARLGHELGMPELMGWHVSRNREKIEKEFNGNVETFLEKTLSIEIPKGAKHGTKNLSA